MYLREKLDLPSFAGFISICEYWDLKSPRILDFHFYTVPANANLWLEYCRDRGRMFYYTILHSKSKKERWVASKLYCGESQFNIQSESFFWYSISMFYKLSLFPLIISAGITIWLAYDWPFLYGRSRSCCWFVESGEKTYFFYIVWVYLGNKA